LHDSQLKALHAFIHAGLHPSLRESILGPTRDGKNVDFWQLWLTLRHLVAIASVVDSTQQLVLVEGILHHLIALQIEAMRRRKKQCGNRLGRTWC